MSDPPAPLDGIRVVDLGVILAGPFGAMLLGDLGAEVIRVESTQYFGVSTRGLLAHPTREMVRRLPPISGGYPDREPGLRPWNRFPWFNSTARNKLGMTVDLRSESGKEIFKRLVSKSDVVISNQTPGATEKLGLGYDVLSTINPSLIYVEATAFGSTGPYRGYRGRGPQVEAFSGHDLLRHYPERDVSSNTWTVTADSAASLAIAMSAEMALYEREASGKGQRIDVALVESFISMIGPILLDYAVNGRVARPVGNRHRTAVQGCYQCAGEDRWLVLTVPDNASWASLSRALGDPEWCQDSRFATTEARHFNHDEIDRRLSAWTRTRDRQIAVAELRTAGVMAGPVMDDADAMSDPHLAAREYFLEVEQLDSGLHRYPGMPHRFTRRRLEVKRPPVGLGEHNALVYKEILGYSDEEFARFEAEGHIGTEYAPHVR